MSSTVAKRFWFLSGLWILVAMPLAAGSALIYVTNRGGTTIDVIDAATNKVVQTIGNIESPEVVRFSPDGRQLYIFSRTDPEKDFLIVMDRKSGKIVKNVPLSGWANEAQTTKDGKLILVCIRNTGTKAEDAGALDIIDTTYPGEGKEHPGTKRGLHDLAVTGDGKFVAAGAPGGHFLVVFDLQKMETAWEVQYDSGVNPIVIENNPGRLGSPDLRTTLALRTASRWWILPSARRWPESRSRRAERVRQRVRSHLPRHRYLSGPEDSLGQQQDGQFCLRLLAA